MITTGKSFSELDHKESWAPKNWCFWTVVLEKTLESPLDCKDIKPVHPKGNQSWIFTGTTDAEAATPILWPPDVKNWLIGKDPDAGEDQRQEEKGTTEGEMARWHHGLDGCESEWTPGVGDGQGGLECCDSWGLKESDTTERLQWTELNWTARISNQSIIKEISPQYSFGTTDAEAATPIIWPPDAKKWLTGKDPDPGKDWKQEEKGTTEDWDGWMASLTLWTWVWASSGSWWWTGKPAVLHFTGLQRVRHDWATKLNSQ